MTTFTVEDGTGLPDANAYASVEYADAYFGLRKVEEWASLSVEKKQAALVLATDYMETVWGKYYVGSKLTDEQALGFPRNLRAPTYPPKVYYPEKLLRACVEYAIRASRGELAPDPTLDETGRVPTVKREKFAVFEEETRWSGGNGPVSGIQILRPMPVPDTIMYSLVSTSSNLRVIR